MFRLLLSIFLIFSIISCQKHTISKEDLENDIDLSSVVPETLVVKVTEDLAAQIESDPVATKSSALPLAGISSVRRVFPPAGKFEERTRKEGLHLWYQVELDKNQILTKSKSNISNIQGVQVVEYFPKVVKNDIFIPFDDPLLIKQWHNKNNGSLVNSKAGADINVYPVWEEYTTGSSDVVVAVVDSGVEYTHEDLAPNMWINEAEMNGLKGVDDDNNGYVDDIYGYNFVYNTGGKISPETHGTHVAGTIAAVNNNGIGVSGIAGGNAALGIKGVRIMSCQNMDKTDESSNTPAAIKYGADNGAVISQNSWSLGDEADTPQHYKEAINYFIKYAGLDENGNQVGPMKGGLVIFAAGNSGGQLRVPANYPPCIAVTAVRADYVKAYYSAYGEGADIAAPGGDIKYNHHPIISTDINNSYGSKQGTSMAAPHVSGVAALLVSYFGKEKGLTAEDVKARLLNCVTPIQEYYPYYLGSGLVNAYAAFNGNQPPVKIKEFDNLLFNSLSSPSISLLFSDYFKDKDKLTYAISVSEEGVVDYIENDGILSIKPKSFGTVLISITVSDNFNKPISAEFKLVVRDDSHPDEEIIAVDIFPNPVNEFLNVRLASSSSVKVKIFNSYGGLVHQIDDATDPFTPLVFDFSELSSGTYTVVVNSDGKQIKRNIVKL